MTTCKTREYLDPATGEVVARYASPDGQHWWPVFTTEEMNAREEARRSVRAEEATDQGGKAGPV